MNTRAISRVCYSSSVLNHVCRKAVSTSSAQSAQKDNLSLRENGKEETKAQATNVKRKKTMKEIDEEIRAAMEGRSGDGGISGAELEGGKAVAMKRGVRDNMFRYI